jgi:hypothetical protein
MTGPRGQGARWLAPAGGTLKPLGNRFVYEPEVLTPTTPSIRPVTAFSAR